ncbi:MAG: YHS domain-containing protein [Thermomicrobiales bacterium]
MATARDPVCGMEVDSSLAAAQMVYQGHAYYFCSEECLRRFRQNPGRYTTASDAGERSDG